LPVGDLTLEWQAEEAAKRLELRNRGLLTLNGKTVGRISGSCVLDPQGRVLRSLGPSGIVLGTTGERIGTLSPRTTLQVDSQSIPIGYVIVDRHQNGSAVSDGGDPYIIPPNAPPFAAVGHIGGASGEAKRTALVLWELGPSLAP
jgi:hypothetical protein